MTYFSHNSSNWWPLNPFWQMIANDDTRTTCGFGLENCAFVSKVIKWMNELGAICSNPKWNTKNSNCNRKWKEYILHNPNETSHIKIIYFESRWIFSRFYGVPKWHSVESNAIRVYCSTTIRAQFIPSIDFNNFNGRMWLKYNDDHLRRVEKRN